MRIPSFSISFSAYKMGLNTRRWLMVLNTRKSRIHTDSIDRKRDVHYSPFCPHLLLVVGEQKERNWFFTDWDTLYQYLDWIIWVPFFLNSHSIRHQFLHYFPKMKRWEGKEGSLLTLIITPTTDWRSMGSEKKRLQMPENTPKGMQKSRSAVLLLALTTTPWLLLLMNSLEMPPQK